MPTLDDAALDLLFRNARTHRSWQQEPVTDETLRHAWDLARLAPTSANTNPGRILFVRSAAAKERLLPALAAGNVEHTKAAPVTAVMAYDLAFYDHLPKLAPHMKGARETFAADPAAALDTATMNATLQAGYFLLAARGVGLDCGPMAGFDRAKVDATFFADTTWRSLFLMNLGHGDGARMRPRGERLAFDEACQII